MVRGGAAAFGYAVSPAGETHWFARVPGEELTGETRAGTTSAQWRDRLVALLAPDATPAADIVRATGDRLMVTNAHDLSPGTRWHAGPMVLTGDAAHAASPATGQGASMALEDAVVLGKALRDRATIDAALDTYERLRRPRVEHNIDHSARMSAARSPDDLGRAVSGGAAEDRSPLPGRDAGLASWLDWQTPLPG